MSVEGIYRLTQVSLEPEHREKSGKKRKKSEALQGISSELSDLLHDLCIWMTKYPLASIMELNLDDSIMDLKNLSIRLRATLDDLGHYLDIIPENSDNDVAKDMLQMLEDDLRASQSLTLCTYKENPHFSFTHLLQNLGQIEEKELSVMLFHLFQEIDERSWKQVRRLFTDLMKKCA